ncbi:tripartite motif-containing protein 2-like [Ptychodera flava]|uniref:tripartite motif-containing protein 2-like n=1 Tax=Ptychodera flava TaxID=63121 RepID=UPI003969CB29
MAASSDFNDRMLTEVDDKVLTCGFCRQRFKSPKTLPCHHTFCELCLTKQIETKTGRLVCLTCDKQWPLPSGGVASITNNRFLIDLSEVVDSSVSQEKTSAAVCEGPGCKKEAKYWCGDCGGHFYCNVCVQTHEKVTVLKDHEPMKIEEYNEKMTTQHFRMTQPKFCDSHHSGKLDIYCDTCQVPICQKCTVVDHPTNDHKVMSLTSALEKYMPQKKAHYKKVAQKVSSLTLRRDSAHEARINLDANRTLADQQIKTLSQKSIGEIKVREMKLLGQVDNIYISKSKQIDGEIELLEHRLASEESIHLYLTHLLTFGGAVHMATTQKGVGRQLNHEDLPNVPRYDSNLAFTENPDCLRMSLGVVEGSIVIKEGKPRILRQRGYKRREVRRHKEGVTEKTEKIHLEVMKERDVTENKLTLPEIEQPAQKKFQNPVSDVQLIKLKGDWSKFTLKGQGLNSGQTLNYPRGLTFHNNKLLVCDRANSIVQILNEDYTREKVLGSFSGQFAKPFQPQSVAVSKENHYFILDDNNLQIVVCDQDDKVIRIINLPADTKPYCIALLKGFLFVTDVKRHRLLKYTKNGEYVAEIGGQGNGRTQFKRPYFVAVNSRGVIMVSDCANHCIKCFDIELNYLYQYGKVGQGNGQLYYVYSIAFDSDDNVYACDEVNNRIVKWSSDGKWICNLFKGEVSVPWYIVVSRDRICVRGVRDKHITVFTK